MTLVTESPMRYRWLVILTLLLLIVWLAAGCSPATPTSTPQATARTPAPTRLYDVPLPPATATARALQSPTPAATNGPVAEGIKLTILHTNDSRGYVDPCG